MNNLGGYKRTKCFCGFMTMRFNRRKNPDIGLLARLAGPVMLALFSVATIHAQSKAADYPVPRYDLKDLAVQYGVKQGDQTGILAKITVATSDASGISALVRITLLDEDEEPLEDTDGRFAVDGTVGAELTIEPTKNPMDVTLNFFVPYDDIEVIGSGEQTLMIDVDVVDEFGELLQHLGFHEFLFTVGSTGSLPPPSVESGMGAVLTDITVEQDVIQEGTGFGGVRIRFTADQVTGLKGIDALIMVRFLKGGESGDFVQSALRKYGDEIGRLAVTYPINAGFDPAKFSNVEVFVPYSAFALSKGAHTLDIDFDIVTKTSEEISVHIGYKTFELKIK